jgi:hypothetical protein
VLHSSALMVKAFATQRQTTGEAIRDLDHAIEELCSLPEDSHLFASLPGAGPVYTARLTAAMGPDSDRWTTADEGLRFSGVAPVLERGGQSTWIRGRYFCPKFLRQSCHEWLMCNYRAKCGIMRL